MRAVVCLSTALHKNVNGKSLRVLGIYFQRRRYRGPNTEFPFPFRPIPTWNFYPMIPSFPILGSTIMLWCILSVMCVYAVRLGSPITLVGLILQFLSTFTCCVHNLTISKWHDFNYHFIVLEHYEVIVMWVLKWKQGSDARKLWVYLTLWETLTESLTLRETLGETWRAWSTTWYQYKVQKLVLSIYCLFVAGSVYKSRQLIWKKKTDWYNLR